MDLDTLWHAKFGTLGTAVEDWATMVKKLETLEKDARDGLMGMAEKANWTGVNASVSKEFIAKTAREFTDAHTAAQTVHNILKDTHEELVEYQRQLIAAMEDGYKKNLTVMGLGNGSFTVALGLPEGRAGATTQVEAGQQDVDDLRDRVQRILQGATTSDDSAAQVLNELMQQAEYGFSSASYRDRDSAAKPVADAEKYADLIKKKGENMSPQEFDALNKVLAANRNDPLFQEKFTLALGEWGLLDFYSDLCDTSDRGVGDARRNQLGDLQKNLSMVLAGATHSDSPAMRQWEENMIKLGPEKLRTLPTEPFVGGTTSIFGFQVMSNLMRVGDYDDKFLGKYGNALLAEEKKSVNPDSRWTTHDAVTPGPTLNFIGKDNGSDPMSGYMDSLANSPDASAHFFENKANAQYVLKDRHYFDSDPALEAAGRALTAATTGTDDPQAHGVERTPANNAAFRNALSVLAEAGDDMHREFRDDMAKALVDHGSEFVHSVGTRTIGGDPLSEDDLRVVTKQIARDGQAFRILDEGMYTKISHDIKSSHDPQPGDSLIRAGAVFGFMEESKNKAIGTDTPGESWLTQYAAPIGIAAVGDALPVGDNTFAALAGIPVDAFRDHNQDGIDEETMKKIREAYNQRNERTDDFARFWDHAHPDDPSRASSLENMETAVTNSRNRVKSGWGQD